MSSREITVSVRGLSKRYVIAHEQNKESTLAETVLKRLRRPLRRTAGESFYALQDLSFDIRKGEVVGIIGRNGAGKSTLLKILSRITAPTSGRIDLYGRVGSLLEVGTGFHPELTGRENIFLNGTLLGMPRREISHRFDEIVAFAEVERFLDTPVKRYSSGMYVRLAFSIAAHLQPEILILDEVLAVGDHVFQEKCMNKIQEVARSGRTMLFVSHNLASVARLCTQGIYLAAGRAVAAGPIQEVLDAYLANNTAVDGVAEFSEPPQPEAETAYLSRVELVNDRSEVTGDVNVRDKYRFVLHYRVVKPVRDMEISLKIRDSETRAVLTTSLSEDNADLLTEILPGRYTCEVEFPAMFIVPGTYSVDVAIHQPGHIIYDYRSNLMQFSIADTGTAYSRYGDYRTIGAVFHRLPWKSQRVG